MGKVTIKTFRKKLRDPLYVSNQYLISKDLVILNKLSDNLYKSSIKYLLYVLLFCVLGILTDSYSNFMAILFFLTIILSVYFNYLRLKLNKISEKLSLRALDKNEQGLVVENKYFVKTNKGNLEILNILTGFMTEVKLDNTRYESILKEMKSPKKEMCKLDVLNPDVYPNISSIIKHYKTLELAVNIKDTK